MAHERRRYPRTNVVLDVILEAGGSRWQAKTVDLSPYGIKVTSPDASDKLAPGRSVQLRFPVLDQHAPMSLAAHVARTDPDGVALTFPTLGEQQFARLKGLVDSLLLREWKEMLSGLTGPQQRAAGNGSTTKPVTPAKELEHHRLAATVEGVDRPRPVTGAESQAPAEAGSPARTGDVEEVERLQALLRRRGLEHLQLPPGGVLARQWREFLRRLEAEG